MDLKAQRKQVKQWQKLWRMDDELWKSVYIYTYDFAKPQGQKSLRMHMSRIGKLPC